jgi:hypothetical protein
LGGPISDREAGRFARHPQEGKRADLSIAETACSFEGCSREVGGPQGAGDRAEKGESVGV